MAKLNPNDYQPTPEQVESIKIHEQKYWELIAKTKANWDRNQAEKKQAYLEKIKQKKSK